MLKAAYTQQTHSKYSEGGKWVLCILHCIRPSLKRGPYRCIAYLIKN